MSEVRSESLWSERRWERYAPLAGVLAVILWVISVVVIESADSPDEDAGGQAIAAYFESDGGTILAASFIFMVGTALFIWFLGSLRARLFWAEGGAGRVTAIVFGSGLVVAAMSMGLMAPQAAGGLMAEETEAAIDPGAAQALDALGDGFHAVLVDGVDVTSFALIALVPAFDVETNSLDDGKGRFDHVGAGQREP